MKELLASGSVRNKEKLVFSLKIIISAGLIWFIAVTINFRDIITAIEKAKPLYIVSAFILSFFNLYMQYLKWELTCSCLLNESNRSHILVSLFYGLTGGSFTPARIGEYFGRALPFKNKTLLQIAAATFVDKVFPLLMTVFFGSISSVLFIHYYYKTSPYLSGSLFILLLILFAIILFIMFSNNSDKWLSLLKKYKWFEKHFSKLELINNINTAYIYKMILYSFLFYSCFILQYTLLAAAFTDNVNFINYIWSGNLVMFAKSVIPPVSLGELGIREGASVFFLTRLGGTAAAGFNASIFLFAINVILPSVAGMFLMLKRNDN